MTTTKPGLMTSQELDNLVTIALFALIFILIGAMIGTYVERQANEPVIEVHESVVPIMGCIETYGPLSTQRADGFEAWGLLCPAQETSS